MTFSLSSWQSSLFVSFGALTVGALSGAAIAFREPVTIILGSGLGAFGASAITQNRKFQQNNNQLEEITKKAHAKNIQHQNETKEYFASELNQLKRQLETISQANQVNQQTLNNFCQHYQQALTRVETTLTNRLEHLVNLDQLVNFEHQLRDSLVPEFRSLTQKTEAAFQTSQSNQSEILNQLNHQALGQVETAVAHRLSEIEKIIATTSQNSFDFHSQETGLRTVIFYDIENFTGGYNNSNRKIDQVSIQDILDQIRALNCVGEILGQYAYADWSNGSVKKVRQQVSELGIKPEQAMIFRFNSIKSKADKNEKNDKNDKNGRDMQITVDAINLIHQNPLIQCVVIASGDSDFIPLAEKLRFYGKVVVGCAYVDSTSPKFRALCHHFVDVPDLRNGNQTSEPKTPNPQSPPVQTKKADQIENTSATPPESASVSPKPPVPQGVILKFEQELWSELGQENVSDSSEAIQKILKILNAYFYKSPDSKKWQKEGIHTSLIEHSVKFIVPNAREIFLQLGLTKFNEYLRFTCHDSSFCMARNNNVLKLFLRDNVSDSFLVEPRPETANLHHSLTYHNILSSHFPELFHEAQKPFEEKLPDVEILKFLASSLLSIRPNQQDLKSLTQEIFSMSAESLAESKIRSTIFVFRSAGVVTQYIEQIQPPTRYISLVPEMRSLQDIHQALDKAIRSKLAPVLSLVGETIDETVMAKLLFDPD